MITRYIVVLLLLSAGTAHADIVTPKPAERLVLKHKPRACEGAPATSRLACLADIRTLVRETPPCQRRAHPLLAYCLPDTTPLASAKGKATEQ